MEVDCFLLCDGAQALNGKVYILGGGWNTIWAAKFPADHKLSVAVGLRIGWNETNVHHVIELNTMTADNDAVQSIAKADFETGRPPGLKHGTDQLVMIAVDSVIKLEAPGELQLGLTIDGALVKSIPFNVVQAPPQMIQQPPQPPAQ